MRKLQEEFAHVEPSAESAKRLQERLGQFDPEQLRSIARRVMMSVIVARSGRTDPALIAAFTSDTVQP